MKILILVITATALWQGINAQYRAAVVEYSPLSDSTPNDTVATNINEYINLIESVKSSRIQIIVFPEYGLSGLIEDPTEYAIEIPDNETVFENLWLQRLSTAAIEYNLYVVVNLLEKAKNENNATIYYNTNVVFDKRGVIIAKYRKINLFSEPNITPGDQIVTFTTDFGVFGIITCADILYYNPSRSILNSSVTNIIFPTAWTSTLPFYHSLSIQSGYAQANQVNLLAADLNNPSRGLGGSGIYSHDGTVLSYYISGLSSTKILISDVTPRGIPRDPSSPFTPFGFDILNNSSESELQKFISSRDFQSSKYQFKQIDFQKGQVQETLCHGSYCCNFRITAAEVNTTDVYQLVVYNGLSPIGESNKNIRICILVACETSDKNSCGTRNVTVTTKFSEISISGNFESNLDHFYQPVTLTTNLLPVFNTTFTSTSVNDSLSVNFNTTRIAEKVVVFGLFGRGGASTLGSSIIFLVALSIVKYLF